MKNFGMDDMNTKPKTPQPKPTFNDIYVDIQLFYDKRKRLTIDHPHGVDLWIVKEREYVEELKAKFKSYGISEHLDWSTYNDQR